MAWANSCIALMRTAVRTSGPPVENAGKTCTRRGRSRACRTAARIPHSMNRSRSASGLHRASASCRCSRAARARAVLELAPASAELFAFRPTALTAHPTCSSAHHSGMVRGAGERRAWRAPQACATYSDARMATSPARLNARPSRPRDPARRPWRRRHRRRARTAADGRPCPRRCTAWAMPSGRRRDARAARRRRRRFPAGR